MARKVVSSTGVDALVDRVTGVLAPVPGVAAVVLGGSRARGTARDDSDFDFGIYYQRHQLPERAALQAAAAKLGEGSVTAMGDWGPWVNGGAWLRVGDQRVDWLFREVERVAEVIADARDGITTAEYSLGHPHAFHSHIYLGEVHFARVLHDPQHAVAALKVLTARYPPALGAEIVRRYLYDARFMLDLARPPAAAGDTYHAAGCLFRVVAAVVQVIYALNQVYFVNEKGSVEEAARMALAPERFGQRVAAILGGAGRTGQRLSASVERAAQLLAHVEALAAANGYPRPKASGG
jgi:hypothetical protein